MSALLRLLAVGLLVAAGAAQAQTLSAAATVSPSRVAVGERVAYTLSLRGTTGRALTAPSASTGLRLVQPRPTSDVTTQINGRVEREVTWTFEAVRPGPARIGPVRVPVGSGQVLVVDAATVRVGAAAASAPAPASPSAARPDADLFARIELSREGAVVGQQVVAEVVLYFVPRLQPHQTMVSGAWDAPGFWREELDVASTVPHPVVLGGRAYEAVTLRRLALFPTRAGRLTLPPMRFTVDFLRVDPFDPFAPFFSPFSSGFEEREVEAPATSITVSPLPAGAPAEFGGAVGQFVMTAAPVPTAVAAGDPVPVRLTISGTGNVATLDAPALRPPPGVDAFRPRDAADVDRTGLEVRGTKTFTYPLVPAGGGQFDVPPAVWSYFDPETGAYRTLRTDTLRLDVSGAPAAGADRPAAPTGPVAALIDEPGWSRPGPPVGVLWGVLGAGLGAPALALGAAALVRRRRRKAAADTPESRRRNALARANERLGHARAATGPEAYAESERAVHAFLADRFGLSSVGLDRQALAEALEAHGVPEPARLLSLLDALDAGQFAPGLAPLDARAAADEAAAVLTLVNGDATPVRRRARRAPVAALLVLAATGAHAQGLAEADRLFALGTQLVAEGDTAGAVAAFEGAAAAGTEAGRVSAAAEHDLGALALARGDAGRARLHTERAARLAPLDARVAQNAALARALAGAPAETPAGRAWRVVRGVVGPAGLVALALALAYAALGLALAGKKRPALAAGVCGVVALAAAVGALVGASRAEGVVTAAVEVRDAPAGDASPGGALAPGRLVRLGERRGAWQQVRTDDGSGWAPAGAVEPL